MDHNNLLIWEQNILAKCKQDIKEFEPIYERFYDSIFRYIFRRLSSEDESADITAQVFLKAISNIKSYEYKGVSILNWLYKIAGNEVKMYYRNAKKSETLFLEEEVIINLYEENLGKSETLNEEKLAFALKQISEKDLEIIELKYFEGLTFEEIAFIKDLKVSAIKMRMYRALEKLKDLIK